MQFELPKAIPGHTMQKVSITFPPLFRLVTVTTRLAPGFKRFEDVTDPDTQLIPDSNWEWGPDYVMRIDDQDERLTKECDPITEIPRTDPPVWLHVTRHASRDVATLWLQGWLAATFTDLRSPRSFIEMIKGTCYTITPQPPQLEAHPQLIIYQAEVNSTLIPGVSLLADTVLVREIVGPGGKVIDQDEAQRLGLIEPECRAKWGGPGPEPKE